MAQRESRWSMPVHVSDVPAEGRRFAVSVGEAERAEVARLLGLAKVPRLDLDVHVSPGVGGGLHVAGAIRATVTQACVVTLDPVDNTVEEEIDLTFVPSGEVQQDAQTSPTFDAPEPPESLVDGRIDLAAIAIEFLQLGLDPYPRKAGVEFQQPEAGDGAASPFAALAGLKGQDRGR